jgi:MoxR-like ATPase
MHASDVKPLLAQRSAVRREARAGEAGPWQDPRVTVSPTIAPLPTIDADLRAIEEIAQARAALRREIGHRIIGQQGLIDHVLIALLCRGHCLLVGVPGLGKTLMVATLAEALALRFGRVQFTPDLMPSDITGTEILEEDRASGQRSFRFVPGPVFANLILADEVNRTPPKTQAALLQAMQERRVSVGGKTHELPSPFLVFATQNPIEQEGTYPLPEAQLDRFMLELRIGYPAADEELAIAQLSARSEAVPLQRVLDPARILQLQSLVERAPISEHVARYAVELVRATRPGAGGTLSAFVDKNVSFGAGPRASQFLVVGAKARALLEGRPTATRGDVAELAPHVLAHRIVPSFAAEAEGRSGAEIVAQVLASHPA